MNNVISYILARLTERSSWVGLTGVASLIGIGVNPAHADTIAMAGAAVASIVQIAWKDRHPTVVVADPTTAVEEAK